MKKLFSNSGIAIFTVLSFCILLFLQCSSPVKKSSEPKPAKEKAMLDFDCGYGRSANSIFTGSGKDVYIDVGAGFKTSHIALCVAAAKKVYGPQIGQLVRIEEERNGRWTITVSNALDRSQFAVVEYFIFTLNKQLCEY